MATTVAVKAYAIASTLVVREMAPLLVGPRGAGEKPERLTKTQLTAPTGPGRWVVAYDFGAVVFFGYDEEECKRQMARVLEKVGPEPHPPLSEEILVEIDPERPAEVLFDRVRLPSLDERSVGLVALVVAQSAAMDYYEEDVEALLAKVHSQIGKIEQTGSFRGSLRSLLKFVGSAMATRNNVVTTLSLLDTPDVVWNDERLDSVYRGLRKTFEIEDRYRALDYKLQMVRDNLEILVDLAQTRRSLTLEVGIIALIALELVIAVYQVYHH